MGGRLTMEGKPGQDRISELPDDVLYHILSFLTIKEAIVTSVLSTRWRFLWTMVPSLDIECSKPIMEHYKRVNVFLGLFRTQNITRFHLRCNSNIQVCCSCYAEEWFNAVVSRKVEHVNISLNMCQSDVFRFPDLFICTTLVTLKLQCLFRFSIPSDVHLPNLKIFHLSVLVFFCLPSIKKLISGSPSLELFELFNLRQNGRSMLKIIRKHNSQVIQTFRQGYLYNLHIQDDCDCDLISHFCFCNRRYVLKSKVYLTVYRSTNNIHLNTVVSTILQLLHNVEFLSLGDFREETDPSILDLPKFENLVELRLFLKSVDSLFMKLPEKCPKLKVLEVNIMDDRYGINQRCRYHITGGVRQRDLSIVPL